MTPEEIAACRERIAKATPGPWVFRAEARYPYDGVSDGTQIADIGEDGGNGPCVYVCAPSSVEALDVADDASFIAAAREDLPKALDALEAARAKLDDRLHTLEGGDRMLLVDEQSFEATVTREAKLAAALEAALAREAKLRGALLNLAVAKDHCSSSQDEAFQILEETKP